MGIYVFAPNADDFSTMGLCGRLTPTRCEHDEVAGGMSELLLEHPLDSFEYNPGKKGRFQALEPGCVIKAPVPVRTTPEIQNGQVVTTVEQWTVKPTATANERTMYTKATNGKKKKVVPGGTTVTVVARGDERYKIKSGKNGTGWIAIDALENRITETIPNDPSGIETVEPAWSIQDQLFRIYEVESTDKGVTARARHISYDLLGNLTNYEADNPTLDEALFAIMDNCLWDHDFEAKTNIESQRVDVKFVDENPIHAMLDPEVGLLHRYGAELVRDNYEMIFLSRAGMDRGFSIEYSKNMLGVNCQVDFSDIATAILPYGENKDGERIYLSDDPDKPSKNITAASIIKSPILGNYPFPRIYPLNVQDAKIDSKKGGKDVTPALACKRLREAAQEMFEGGADLPAINVKVEFLKLGDTVQYAQYKGLDDVFLYDTVRVRHKGLGLALNLDVVRIKFDCLRERVIETELGTLRDMLTSIASWQISSLNGSKITPFSLGGGAFENEFISARLIQADAIRANHIQAGTIEARHIQAEVISAEHINTALLVSEKIIAGICDIIQANILKADIGEAHIDWAGITDLQAIYAEIASAEIGKAKIGYAQIQDLVAGTAIIREGVGGQLFIDRLAVTEANMVTLTTGELIIKGKDGHFYSLSVDEDGNVISTLKQVSGGDVENHSLNAGEKIVEGTITAGLLNVKQIFASDALIGAITAANIDVGTLVAALIQSNLGETLDLSSNKAIQSIVNNDIVRQMIADSTRELRVTYDGAGTHMREDTDTTTMTAYVYEGNKDVTHTIPHTAYIWSRNSGDPEADAAWNAAHVGMRQITVTRADVNNRSIIECTLLSVGDMALTFEVDPLTMTLTVTSPAFGTDTASYDPTTGVLTINGTGYVYDPETQTITFSSGLSSARTTVQYTFSDETGVQTRILQLRNEIFIDVQSPDGGTQIHLTENMAGITGRDINLDGRVSIGDLTPVAQMLLDEIEAKGEKALADAIAAAMEAAAAQGTALSAMSAAEIAQQIANSVDMQILSWCMSGNRTYINGSKLYTGSVTSDKINVSDLYAWRLRDPAKTSNSWLATWTGMNYFQTAPESFGIEIYHNALPTGRFGAMASPAMFGGSGSKYIDVALQGRTHNSAYWDGGVFGSDANSIILCSAPSYAGHGTSGASYDNTIDFLLANRIAGQFFHNLSNGNYGLYVYGNIQYTGNLNSGSDRRIKKDIAPLADAVLDMILRIPAVSYRLIDDSSDTEQYGFIAQDVQACMVDLGIEGAGLVDDSNSDRLALNYIGLIAPIVALAQRHEERINALEQENTDLRARLARIEQMLGVETIG